MVKKPENEEERITMLQELAAKIEALVSGYHYDIIGAAFGFVMYRAGNRDGLAEALEDAEDEESQSKVVDGACIVCGSMVDSEPDILTTPPKKDYIN